VKKSCIKKGMITQQDADKLSDLELQMLVFKQGASTNDVVTEVSGRGVGMDVVISTVRELGGTVKLNSVVGKGTTITLQLPLTVAIVTSLLVKVKDDTYAIPLTTVDEIIDINKDAIKTIKGNEVFILRGREVPLLWLHQLMGYQFDRGEKATVVIVNKEQSQIGLVVDSILAQQQVLIKSLQDLVKGTKGIAGATILGDGSVVLILDIATLI
jgi:two-component system, chemotaxis family, sensor kinase CheA